MGNNFFDRLEQWEKWLQVVLAVSFAFLVILQVFMTQDPLRFYLSFAERMEGVPWPGGEPAVTLPVQKRVGKVKIKLCSYFSFPGVVVLVNGREVAGFQDKEVTLHVRSGDEIMVDGSAYACRLIFQVTAVSRDVCWPPADYLVTTDASRVSLGKVRIER